MLNEKIAATSVSPEIILNSEKREFSIVGTAIANRKYLTEAWQLIKSNAHKLPSKKDAIDESVLRAKLYIQLDSVKSDSAQVIREIAEALAIHYELETTLLDPGHGTHDLGKQLKEIEGVRVFE